MSRAPSEYAPLRELVTKPAARSGTGKEALFETRPNPISKLAVAASLEGLVNALRDAQPEHLQRAVVESRAINGTSFFRDEQPFEALRTKILPRLIAGRQKERRLRLWSAACSTGQEAYSLALLLVHSFPELADWDVRIIGTDLSDRAVASATQGCYRHGDICHGLPEYLSYQYFELDGDNFRVCDEVRRICEFRVADLCAPQPELPIFDLILLRNVLLYLPLGERKCVFETAHRHLGRKGFLMLGDAEEAEDSTHLFVSESEAEPYFYRPVAGV